MVWDCRKTKCHLWITAATVKDKGNHDGVLLSPRSEEYLVVSSTSPSQNVTRPGVAEHKISCIVVDLLTHMFVRRTLTKL